MKIYLVRHGQVHHNASHQCNTKDEDLIDAGIEQPLEVTNRIEYWNRIVEAVNSTIGKVIMYDGKVINAVYHANSGGITEIASGVWSGGDYPYLQSVETFRRR